MGLLVRMVEWIAHRHREERRIMNHVVLHDVRASFFLMVGLAMLAGLGLAWLGLAGFHY